MYALPLPSFLPPVLAIGGNTPQGDDDGTFMAVMVVVFVLVTAGMLAWRLLRKRSPAEFACEKCGSLNVSAVGETATCVDCGHVADIVIDPGPGSNAL